MKAWYVESLLNKKNLPVKYLLPTLDNEFNRNFQTRTFWIKKMQKYGRSPRIRKNPEIMAPESSDPDKSFKYIKAFCSVSKK